MIRLQSNEKIILYLFNSLANGGIDTTSADDKFGRGTPTKKPKEKNDTLEGLYHSSIS